MKIEQVFLFYIRTGRIISPRKYEFQPIPVHQLIQEIHLFEPGDLFLLLSSMLWMYSSAFCNKFSILFSVDSSDKCDSFRGSHSLRINLYTSRSASLYCLFFFNRLRVKFSSALISIKQMLSFSFITLLIKVFLVASL